MLVVQFNVVSGLSVLSFVYFDFIMVIVCVDISDIFIGLLVFEVQFDVFIYLFVDFIVVFVRCSVDVSKIGVGDVSVYVISFFGWFFVVNDLIFVILCYLGLNFVFLLCEVCVGYEVMN